MKKAILTCLLCIHSILIADSDIAVASMAIGSDYQKIVGKAIENKRNYCKLHSYAFYCATSSLDTSRPPPWSKILLLFKIMEESSHQWIFWSDADSLIMNLAVDLQDFIHTDKNLIITKDENGINSGQFFIRNCEWSKQLLKKIYSHTECIHHPWWEQQGLLLELKNNPELLDHIKIMPQAAFNSYAKELTKNKTSIYNKGDFIIHFASARGDKLKNLINKYSTQVINDVNLVYIKNFYEAK